MIVEFLVNIAIFSAFALWQKYRIAKSKKLVLRWFNDRNYIIEEINFKLFDKGPYWSHSYLFDLVFRISVKGFKKDCWIRVGYPIIGMLFNKNFDVKWRRTFINTTKTQ